MAFSANGASLLWAGTAIVGATKIGATINGAKIDISSLAGSSKLAECGLKDLEFTVECVGRPTTPAIQAIDTVEYCENGETAGQGTVLAYKFVCIERTTRCGVDGAITTTIKLAPTATAIA